MTIDNYAFYSQTFSFLPEDSISTIANPANFQTLMLDGGSKSHIYKWDDLKVTVNSMPESRIEGHLVGFVGYIHHISEAKNIAVDAQLTKRVSATTMVLGIIVEPGGSENNSRVLELLGEIATNTNSLVFFKDTIFDENANYILGPH